ncbi:MAG: carboxypeptidase-like regulatory domain-containing protein [Bacteroidota bacterium]
MPTKITVSIPQPCHKNWQAMTVVEKGRFCASCQKNVIDFTTASDRQIIEAFNKNEKLCGRFTTSQLNRELILPKDKNSIWLAASATIISFLGLGSQSINAQEKVPVEQTDKKLINENTTPENPGGVREITGIVSDQTGPLPDAYIVIKGTTIGVQTDIDGKFSIKAKDGDVLVISFIGMKEKELIVNDFLFNQIKNTTDKRIQIILIEASTGGLSVCKKRSFFGRLFHKNKYRTI